MLLKNAKIFTDDFHLEQADIAVENGKISGIGAISASDSENLDLTDCTVTPGFVDIHIHGGVGFDTCDGTREAIAGIAGYLAKHGVTSFCPTTMTVSPEEIKKALLAVKQCMEQPPEGAAVRGVNMEGPYINAHKKGAQREECVRTPDWEQFRKFFELSGGIVKLVDIAPECEGAEEFIRHASQLCTVSLAHTEATYEQATESFRNGITHATHLFNAMPGLSHRAPGSVGAVFDSGSVRAELICDGFHIHPATLRIAFRQLGEDRTIVISDSMRAAGQPDGDYDLGGQTVLVRRGEARLADGTIAGSTTNLCAEVKNLISFGIPLRQVIKSATINPAREIGIDGITGSIRTGKAADLNVFDGEWNLLYTFIGGKMFQNR